MNFLLQFWICYLSIRTHEMKCTAGIKQWQLQYLDVGPCKSIMNYCESKITNSICSERNECICKEGHVSVLEDNGLECKPMLTSVKCSTDLDCFDIEKSVCHSGVGYCICPSGMQFIPAKHSCYSKTTKESPLCNNCKEQGKNCYENFQEEMFCFCSLPFKSDKDNMCSVLMVDISNYCNGKSVVCRSRNSICRKTNNSFIKICFCRPGYTMVFQKHLQYHECYPIVNDTSKFCLSCQNQIGQCVDLNNDTISDGCVVSNELIQHQDLAKLYRIHKTILRKIEEDKYLFITCWHDQLEVCLQFQTDKNYQKYPCEASEPIIIIEAQKYNQLLSTSKCQSEKLIFYDNSPLCLSILNKFQKNETKCEIRIQTVQDFRYFYGLIKVRHLRYIALPVLEKQYEMICRTSLRKLQSQIGYALERQWTDSIEKQNTIFHDYLNIINIKQTNKNQRNERKKVLILNLAATLDLKKQNI